MFGRDFDTKVVLWGGDGASGWAKWLSMFVDDLESGEGYDIGMGDNSDVLEGFDFDSLLNMDQTTGGGFDIDPTQFPFADGVEMNAGDQ